MSTSRVVIRQDPDDFAASTSLKIALPAIESINDDRIGKRRFVGESIDDIRVIEQEISHTENKEQGDCFLHRFNRLGYLQLVEAGATKLTEFDNWSANKHLRSFDCGHSRAPCQYP